MALQGRLRFACGQFIGYMRIEDDRQFPMDYVIVHRIGMDYRKKNKNHPLWVGVFLIGIFFFVSLSINEK